MDRILGIAAHGPLNELASSWATASARYGETNLTVEIVGDGHAYVIRILDDLQGAGPLVYTERFDEAYRGDEPSETDEYVPTENDLAWAPLTQRGHWVVREFESFSEPGVREFLDQVCEAIYAKTGRRPRKAPVKTYWDDQGRYYEARLWVRAAAQTETTVPVNVGDAVTSKHDGTAGVIETVYDNTAMVEWADGTLTVAAFGELTWND